MPNCEFFEVIEWDEDTNSVIHAVCTLPSPNWPNCLKCQSRVEYNEPETEEEEAMFFVINVGKMTREDIVEAMFMLSYHHVKASMYSDGSSAISAYMVVQEDHDRPGSSSDGVGALRLAEMAFQMAFHQDGHGNPCPHCNDPDSDKDVPDTCGHFSFTKQIKPAF